MSRRASARIAYEDSLRETTEALVPTNLPALTEAGGWIRNAFDAGWNAALQGLNPPMTPNPTEAQTSGELLMELPEALRAMAEFQDAFTRDQAAAPKGTDTPSWVNGYTLAWNARQSEIDRLREFAGHKRDCLMNTATGYSSKPRCDCGWETLDG